MVKIGSKDNLPIGAVVVNNLEVVLIDEGEIVGVGNPRGIKNFTFGANKKVGVVFEIINIVIVGLEVTLFGLSASGWGWSNKIRGNITVGLGEVENFVVIAGKLKVLSRVGGNKRLNVFGEGLKFGGKNGGGLGLPVKMDSVEIMGNIDESLGRDGSVKRQKVVYFFKRIGG